METEFRWGILGPGKIAHKFAQSLPYSNGGKLVSVASSNLERASLFAESYGASNVFGSYSDLLKSGTVDAVYISTTNQLHFANASQALESGTPVLCEKPLTDRLAHSKKLIEISRERKVFLMEGMWSVFLPHIQKAWLWIAQGKIGEVVHIQADFGYKANFDPQNRLYNPELGGSVTKDVGIYPISLFYKTIGKLENIQSQGHRSSTGVDDHVLFQGKSESGATFQGMVSFRTKSDVEAVILGTQGKIRLTSQWLRPTSAILETETESETFAPHVEAFGFQFEANEVMDCVRNRRLESTTMSQDDSMAIATYIEQIEHV